MSRDGETLQTLAALARRVQHLETLEPQGAPKELWADVRAMDGSEWLGGAILLDAANELCTFVFVLPENWKATREALIYLLPLGDGAMDWSAFGQGMVCDSDDFWLGFDGGLGEPLAADILKCLDVTDAFTPVVGTQNPGDLAQVIFRLDAITPEVVIAVFGLLYRYS